jgi:hypothetical protein
MTTLAIATLVDHLWQSTLVAIVAGLLVLACRRNRARVRQALWFGASIKFFIPFALITALGGQFAWPRALAREVRPAVLSAALAPATSSASALPSLPRDWRRRAILGVWGIWGVGFFVVAATRIHAWRRRGEEDLTAAIQMVAEAVFWFYPLVWWIGRRSIEERERADDEEAQRIGVGEALGWRKRLVLTTIAAQFVLVPLTVGAMNAASLAPRYGHFTITSYALVLADSDGLLGPRLNRSPRTDCDALSLDIPPCGTYVAALDSGMIEADSITVSQLAELITQAMNRGIVEDRTGLKGHFNVDLTWDAAPAVKGRPPALVTAMEDQLGLKLEPVVSRN